MTEPCPPGDLRLAAEFPAAAQDAWLKLVDKVLAGTAFEKKLVSRTYDGLAIQPLYTRADWNSAGDPSGMPGAAPFTRGGSVLGTSQGGWDVRQSHGHPDPATANAEILADLERGVTSISLRVDPEGGSGVAIRSLADLERTLEGVMLDIAPVALDAFVAPFPYAPLLGALLEKQKCKNFAGNFGIDPLSTLAGRGRLPADAATALACTGDAGVYVHENFPKARAINIAANVYHAAGAADAQELGCALATGIAYLRALTAAGLDIDGACGQIAFTAAVDADFFMSIVKIRALRKIWARVAEACGAKVCSVPITAASATRMMSKRDPWVNMLRTTVACFAGGVGGADAVTVLPFDAARGLPSELGRRAARNTQLVLLEESNLGRVIDPAGGAWMFERLTDELAAKAWVFFQEIEKLGGMAEALAKGFVVDAISAVQSERKKNIAKRKDALTGVSEFPNLHETPDAVVKPWPKTATAPATAPAGMPAPGSAGFMAALVRAAADGAIIGSLIKAAAAPNPATLTKALPAMRLAEPFERLRDAGDAFKETYGRWPKVFLANIGSVADFTARAAFAKNFFEAGGIEAVSGSGGNDAAVIARDFKQSEASFAVLCASDAVYSDMAVKVARALKDAGAVVVYLAGRGGELESALRAAGVDEFIFVGCDVAAILAAAHQKLRN